MSDIQKCINCKAELVTIYGNVDRGYSFSLSSLGHYGGFSDSFEVSSDMVALCHNCCVVLLRALPGLVKPLMGTLGVGHGREYDDGPCCEFSFCHTEVHGIGHRIHVAENGQWSSGFIIPSIPEIRI